MSERKRPSIRRKAPPGEQPKPALLPAKVGGASGGGGGLLASLLGDVAETTKKIGATKATNKTEHIAGSAATAYHQRKEFVAKIERELRESVLQSGAAAAPLMRFEPMDKKWRDLIHEVAADLKLYSVSEGDEEERHVVVHSKVPSDAAAALQLSAADAARTRVAVPTRVPDKKKEKLSDLAPNSSEFMVGLNTKKRDLRSIEEIQADMKNKKEKL